MRLVLLWFGSLEEQHVLLRARPGSSATRSGSRARTDLDGTRQEILSPFSDANRDADARAFAALLKHLRDDGRHRSTPW